MSDNSTQTGNGFESVVNDIMVSLSERGFINYFGMQRFGTSSIPTHHVGR